MASIQQNYSGTILPGSSTLAGTPLGSQTTNPFAFAPTGVLSGTGAFGITTPTQQAKTDQSVLNGALGAAGNLQSQGAGALGASQAGAGALYGQANNLSQLGNQISGEFNGNSLMANNALQQGFDTNGSAQSAALAATQDQASGALNNSGLAGTPYGASVMAGSAGNFENNWQTQQINRENTAASTAEGLQSQELSAQSAGAGLIDAAGQLDQSAVSDILSGYGLDQKSTQAAASTLAQIFGSLGTSMSSSVSS